MSVQKFRNMLSGALAAVLICFTAIQPVRAQEQYTEGEFTYVIEDESAVITGYFGNRKTVTLPGQIAGIPVSRIARDAFTGTTVKELHIPETVMVIEEGAIPGTITVIHEGEIAEAEQPEDSLIEAKNTYEVTDSGNEVTDKNQEADSESVPADDGSVNEPRADTDVTDADTHESDKAEDERAAEQEYAYETEINLDTADHIKETALPAAQQVTQNTGIAPEMKQTDTGNGKLYIYAVFTAIMIGIISLTIWKGRKTK